MHEQHELVNKKQFFKFFVQHFVNGKCKFMVVVAVEYLQEISKLHVL